ncbi:MAG: PspC domain-containing protein [Bacteroidetes bacterium]|nr:PspC domain-containing protein [Bacteroidota bacterium]
MNKTLSIGLAGFSFMIEEHAYLKLSDYLTALRNSLDASEAEEVIHDIEIRMVELFKESLDKREVINDADVEKIIAQIGSPEIIEEQEEAYFAKDKKINNTHIEKQLFRDPENTQIGGVCAGLAHYVGMEITWMRVIWGGFVLAGLVSAGISTLLIISIYVLLWIVLPVAKTTSDMLKMKGKPVNFDNIKQESSKLVDFANESSQKIGEIYNENKPLINRTGSGIWKAIRFFIGGLFGLIGISLLFSSFTILGASINMDFITLPGEFQFYLEDSYLRYFGIVFAFLTIFIPALICMFLSVKLIAPKTKLNYTGYVLAGLSFLWIIFLALFGFKALKYSNQYTGHNEEEDNISINTTSDTLYIDYKKVMIPENFKSYGDEIYSDLKSIYKEDHPYVEVTKKEGNFTPYLLVKKNADGYNQPLKMEVPVEIINNTLLLPNYYKYPYIHRHRDYDVQYELVVPKNKTIINNSDYVNVDLDDHDLSEENKNESVNLSINNNGVKIKNNNLEISTNEDSDSITINGKKYHEKEAEKILKDKFPKELKDLKKMKDINIQIKDDNVSIETK